MATLTEVISSLALMIAQIPMYIGQEPPIEYYNKFMQIFQYGNILSVVGLAEAFIPPNLFQNNADNQINTPILFLGWLEDKYREVMIGTSQASMKVLINEKFSPLDIPDSYKQRIHTFTHSIADADCLSILYNHLSENLELRVRITAPAIKDTFFTNLRNCWLESNRSRKNFIKDELYARLGHANYNLRKEPFGQVREVNTRVITRASTSGAKKVYATKKPQKFTKVTYKCSNCGKIGHRKNKCPKLSKKLKKVNYNYQSKPENSDQEDEPIEGDIAKKYQKIFQPFIEAVNKENNMDFKYVPLPDISEKLSHASFINNSITSVKDTEYHSLNHTIKINFLNIKEPNDVATISCKIGDLIIPHAILDTGANDSLFTDNIPEYLEIKIDTKNVYKLTGVVGDSQSIGTLYNIPISIDSRNDSITVSEKEISVIPTKKDRNGNDISIMILGTKWQHYIRWDPIVKGEFIAIHNGKTITIPLSTCKESCNVFNTEKLQASEKDSKSHDSENRLMTCFAIKKMRKL
ncbi:21356_t:CDS:2 [Cetraspora pellucida]|uniref:21356_t:CDS:1 n=1 Tax=Cetraspora pellucida TaxID=1433469 RepID=A0A9N9GUX0_9GLOM|nr:21356_t:CDS:2 [Cetraspora pellucida]